MKTEVSKHPNQGSFITDGACELELGGNKHKLRCGSRRGVNNRDLWQQEQVSAKAVHTDTLKPAWGKADPQRSVPNWAETDCPSKLHPSKSGYYAGGLEHRWTFLLPGDSARICPWY